MAVLFRMSENLIASLVPLAQTLLWVLLIGFIFIRYRNVIDRFIQIIQGRMESGSSIKAGPLEIGEYIRHQDQESQRIEVMREAEEYVSESDESIALSPKERSDLRANMVIAEDLVLRAIQDEYGEALRRNVEFPGNLTADAVFTKSDELHIIEVKFISGRSTLRVARSGIKQLERLIENHRDRNVRGILALVYLEDLGTSAHAVELEKLIADSSGRIEARTWSLEGLKYRYGIVESETI